MRTLTKTMSYAAMHLVVAVTIAYLISGSWMIALSIGLLEPAVQTVCFFFHEKLWERIRTVGRRASAAAPRVVETDIAFGGNLASGCRS
jgi:uncharacterized membrane protein